MLARHASHTSTNKTDDGSKPGAGTLWRCAGTAVYIIVAPHYLSSAAFYPPSHVHVALHIIRWVLHAPLLESFRLGMWVKQAIGWTWMHAVFSMRLPSYPPLFYNLFQRGPSLYLPLQCQEAATSPLYFTATSPAPPSVACCTWGLLPAAWSKPENDHHTMQLAPPYYQWIAK